jgi:hypothetical protein
MLFIYKDQDILHIFNFYCPGCWDSVVSIARGYDLDDQGVRVRVPMGARIFFTSSRQALCPIQHPIQWVPRALSLGVKRPGLEADHSPQSSAEVKKMWIYTSTPPYVSMAQGQLYCPGIGVLNPLGLHEQ